jgi:STE24 endopeptidase
MLFDPAVEAARYIDGLGPEALQKSAAYTMAGHWHLLVGLVVTAAVTWIIVRTGLLNRLASKLENRSWALRTFVICVTFFLVSAIISLPWGIYEEWGFEKSYGRTSQSFGDFMAQDAIGILLSSILGGLFFLGVYALIRLVDLVRWIGGLCGCGNDIAVAGSD